MFFNSFLYCLNGEKANVMKLPVIFIETDGMNWYNMVKSFK